MNRINLQIQSIEFLHHLMGSVIGYSQENLLLRINITFGKFLYTISNLSSLSLR